MVKERPILFSAPMVRAILEGRKTQTRRIIKLADSWDVGPNYAGECWPVRKRGNELQRMPCPKGTVGEHLWVRENWATSIDAESNAVIIYQADSIAYHILSECDGDGDPVDHGWKAKEAIAPARWRPSIHMPRWASRIKLEITGVRVERLNDISEEDGVAEGIESQTSETFNDTVFRNYEKGQQCWTKSAIGSYRSLWDSINGPGAWDANPWVWVVEFQRMAEPEPAGGFVEDFSKVDAASEARKPNENKEHAQQDSNLRPTD